jgi:hypothetical protein
MQGQDKGGQMQQKKQRRSVHRQREYGRLRQKTREQQFVHQLEREFELSPRESRGILEVVQETFIDKRELKSGQIEYVCADADEGAGKSIEEMRKVRVMLTRECGDDHVVQELSGDSAMRRVQILRMTEEAYDQHGLLTQEDLGRILGVSSRTIRRDVDVLMEQNLKLNLRGLQRDIGKGISHKVWIVRLYLEQKTYSEIERITGHTTGSIKIYLSDFSRVLMAQTRGVKRAKEIAFYIGRTERLVNEYIELITSARRDAQQRERLASLVEQMRHLERRMPLKKGDSSMVWRLV